MVDNRLYVLIGKKVSNELTKEEHEELIRLLQQKSIDPHSLELLQEVWNKKSLEDTHLVEEKWKSLVSKINNGDFADAPPVLRNNKVKRLSGLIAAALISIVVFSIFFFSSENKDAVAQVVADTDSVIIALKGERKRIVLPDGSQVLLNSGSEIRFNNRFGIVYREVFLSGEAFFEVLKDSLHPFFVNTDRMIIKVLGTAFNVKAYNTREDIETMVVHGKVEVSLKEDSEKKVILLTSEKLSLKNEKFYRDDQQQLKYEVVSTRSAHQEQKAIQEEIAWTEEKIVFSDEPFETVALKMERWYDVRIHFEEESMKSILMSGDFDNVDIQQALQILQMLVDFKYEMVNKDIYIK